MVESRIETWLPPRKDSIRLPGWDYAAPGVAYFLTLRAAEGSHPFANPCLTSAVVQNLLKLEAIKRFRVECYVVMSNHVHLLGLSLKGMAHLTTVVNDFKRYITHLCHQRGYSGEVWQRSYYDHVLRPSEPDEDIVKYIMENPIRAGLTGSVGEYHNAKVVARASEIRAGTVHLPFWSLFADSPYRGVLPRHADDPAGEGVYVAGHS